MAHEAEIDAKEVVDFLIRRLRQVPNYDEQELANRIDARRTTFEWWLRDFIKEHESRKKEELPSL